MTGNKSCRECAALGGAGVAVGWLGWHRYRCSLHRELSPVSCLPGRGGCQGTCVPDPGVVLCRELSLFLLLLKSKSWNLSSSRIQTGCSQSWAEPLSSSGERCKMCLVLYWGNSQKPRLNPVKFF